MTPDLKAKWDRWQLAIKVYHEALRHAGIDRELGGEELRNAVFALPDPMERLEVMRPYQACMDAYGEWEIAEHQALRSTASGAHKAGRRTHYMWGAVVFTGFLVLIAYYVWGLIGALVAAAISVPININHMRQADESADKDIAEAKAALPASERWITERSEPLFTRRELETGERG